MCSCAQWWCGKMEGAAAFSDSLSMVGQALGSCPSQLRPHMNPTQAFSSSALGGWVCGVGPYALGSALGAGGGSVACGTGGDTALSSAHLQAKASVAKLVQRVLQGSDSLLWLRG